MLGLGLAAAGLYIAGAYKPPGHGSKGRSNSPESIFFNDNAKGDGGSSTPSSSGNSTTSSPEISAQDLRGKSRDELEQMAKDKGLVQDPKKPNKWRDPVTGDERIRIDPGHVDPQTGQPYDNPRAAKPHVHGYDEKGKKIGDPLAGNDPHFPIEP